MRRLPRIMLAVGASAAAGLGIACMAVAEQKEVIVGQMCDRTGPTQINGVVLCPASLKHYHQRSNVETTIMMWKTSFGDSLRSKTEIAMKNELYCKLICHNISCLIKGMYELKIGPQFLAESLGGMSVD
jgi:hypothetical protein